MIKLRINKDDKEMIELYTERPAFILWGIVHKDFLDSIDNYSGYLSDDLELMEFDFKLEIKPA